ncbi:PREDICTED: inositol oxygenase-like isoform X1 [Branchiostoma belcheri]|uniref:Inositol oxygenase n=1 Tax=Branchiostoma belcheri TaxID=7741 RepID=A0A6P4XTS5_BRABE|nr:PREDICTED: inositol oxygenase-like isoform X1 [Branchiostoma belcheri]
MTTILDPSPVFRPDMEGCDQNFRNFEVSTQSSEANSHTDQVRNTYQLMHTHQTVDFVRRKMEYWCKLDHAQMTMLECLEELNNLVDESDPDVDVPNIYHAFQTAESVREKHPDKDWLQLTGLIHDAGKIMAIWGEPQWCVVGDTFPTGCLPAESVVFRHSSFQDNPDLKDPKFNTKLGMYEENCGLDKVLMSWGHDEYMYHVLKGNNTKLPEEALYVIRFHSFYPWHGSGDYDYLCNNKDREMLAWVKEFNKFDLYSKADELPDIEALKPYYQGLIDKYIPGKLRW